MRAMSLWTSAKTIGLRLVLEIGKGAIVLGTAVQSKGWSMMLRHAVSMVWRASSKEAIG